MTPEERERTREYVRRLDARYRSLRDEVEEDVAPIRGLAPEEIDRRLGALIRSSSEALAALPEEERRQLTRPDPPAPDFPGLWKRLVARYREQCRANP